MKVFVAPGQELLYKSIASKVLELVEKKPSAVIALPTGSTSLPLYKELVKKFEKGSIDFSKTIFMNLDEYIELGQKHSQSYARFLRKNFLDRVNASEKNIFLFNGRAEDLKKEAKKREELVKRKGIDLALLGIGENAHIAFNEPGSSFSSRTRVVNLSKKTIAVNSRFFKNKKQVPKKAITMGIATIMKAKKIILIATGKKKAKAVQKMASGKPGKNVPASALQKHRNAEAYCDAEAGKLVSDALPIEYNKTKIFFEKSLPKKKRIIFVSPHPDDSAIASGALLSMLSKQNKIFVFVMSSGHHAVINGKHTQKKIAMREKEAKAEATILGTAPVFLRLGFYDGGEKNFVIDKRKVLKKMQGIKPDIVFLPHAFDTHPTHKFSRRLAIEAIARLGKKPEIWNFETPWALFSHGKFNALAEFSEKQMEKKLRAIKKHVSQVSRTRFDIAAKNIARFRAISIAEQILSDFGENPPKIMKFGELYSIEPSRKE